jgi:hypothetical protein
MKVERGRSALPFLACLLIGYVPMGKGEAVGGAVAVVPFCAVAEHPEDYVGQTVRVRAIYRTDNSHFEFLKLPSCGANPGLIDIGKHGPSESVRSFYAETKRICTERRAAIVCNISAEVDVVGLIREWPGDPGHVVIDLGEVEEFTVE